MDGITWVPKTNGSSAEFAIHAGSDSGRDLYVARAQHNGGLIPGKLCIGHPHVYIPFGRVEIVKNTYEVLTAPPGTLSWVDVEEGHIPYNAVPGGWDPNGEIYYIGRTTLYAAWAVGKVHRSDGTCYVPYGGRAHEYRNYKILVNNIPNPSQ